MSAPRRVVNNGSPQIVLAAEWRERERKRQRQRGKGTTNTRVEFSKAKQYKEANIKLGPHRFGPLRFLLVLLLHSLPGLFFPYLKTPSDVVPAIVLSFETLPLLSVPPLWPQRYVSGNPCNTKLVDRSSTAIPIIARSWKWSEKQEENNDRSYGEIERAERRVYMKRGGGAAAVSTRRLDERK